MKHIDLNKCYDLTKIEWDNPEGGSTDGMLPKESIDKGNKRIFIKLGSYQKHHGFYGKEPIMELINSRIGEILDFPVVVQDLKRVRVILDGNGYETLACVSDDFKKMGEQSKPFEKEYENIKTKDSMIGFAKKNGLLDLIYKQFVYDYIICNLDRHGKNNEIIQGRNGWRLAPFFDNSFTFITYKPENEQRAKVRFNDETEVNNYIGHRNLAMNLKSIDRSVIVRQPRDGDRQKVFQGLGNITTRVFRDFVWITLERRITNVKEQRIPFVQWK